LDWCDKLRYDPVQRLTDSGNETIRYLAARDLTQQYVPPADILWNQKEPFGILNRQQAGGYWKYPGKGKEYNLIETFKNLLILIYKYEFNRSHHSIEKACQFLFSCQTGEGDFRGFIGNQYAPYYTGLVSALLITAGYENDSRIIKALEWLLSVRQNDGGWVIGSPGITGNPQLKYSDIIYLISDKNAPLIQPYDKSKPFSHSGTGMVIRAFAAHPIYRKKTEVLKAASLLKSRFFKEDNYSSYKDAAHWLRFQFPFWWNNLVAALDSLSIMGISPADKDIENALDWLISKQEPDGLWKISYSPIHKSSVNKKSEDQRLWITLAICRILKRFYG
jgi:hypothetical protein